MLWEILEMERNMGSYVSEDFHVSLFEIEPIGTQGTKLNAYAATKRMGPVFQSNFGMLHHKDWVFIILSMDLELL